MRPLVRVNSMVASLTVVIMYELVPISSQLPNIAPQYIVEFFGKSLFLAGISLLGTIGVYTSLFLVFRLAIDHLRWVKKLALGPSYVEGTWVGFYGAPGKETFYAIDVYKQTLTTTTTEGTGFSSAGIMRARWESDFVRADGDLIEFICVVEMFSNAPTPTTNAITKLKWIRRPGLWKAFANKLSRLIPLWKPTPAEVQGTSVNINDERMNVRMFKFSDDTNWPSSEANTLRAAAEYHKSVKT